MYFNKFQINTCVFISKRYNFYRFKLILRYFLHTNLEMHIKMYLKCYFLPMM